MCLRHEPSPLVPKGLSFQSADSLQQARIVGIVFFHVNGALITHLSLHNHITQLLHLPHAFLFIFACFQQIRKPVKFFAFGQLRRKAACIAQDSVAMRNSSGT